MIAQFFGMGHSTLERVARIAFKGRAIGVVDIADDAGAQIPEHR